MFTIFGASGNTGSVVAKTLVAKGQKVQVLARNAAKVQHLADLGASVVVGDVTDPAAVRAALRGARGAYLMLPPEATSDDLVGRNRKIVDSYVAGIREHGVKHVVLLSSVGSELTAGTGPIITTHHAEQALSRLEGVTTTFVRAAYFTENLLGYVQAMKQDGVLPVFGGGESHAFPWIATADIGRVAAEALLAPPAQSEIIELQGPAEYSFVDAAAEASKILGRPVKAVPLPIDGLIPALTGHGVSPQFAGLVREMTEAFASGKIQFLGTGRSVRGTVTLADVLRPALA